MHIMMVSLDFLPTVGGITAHVYELSQALLRSGAKVSIITRKVKNSQSFEVVDGLDVYRLDLKFFGATYGWQINRYIKGLIPRINPDVIHIHGMRPLEFLSVKNIPLVYTNHTSGYLKRILKGGYRVRILKRLFEKPDIILAPSEELLQIPFDVRAQKIYIPNGVIVEKYKRVDDTRQKIRVKLGLSDEDIVAIVTRRMVWKNGVFDLARATKHITSKRLKIVFVGDGEEYEKIKSELEANFPQRFFLLGSKRHEEIVDLYSAADISILPSLMEATSISGLEAMAASLPLVGTSVGGIPDLIENGSNGYLCAPSNPEDLAQKIDLLLESDYKQMGKNSLKKAQSFDWNEIAQRTLDAYKEVMQ